MNTMDCWKMMIEEEEEDEINESEMIKEKIRKKTLKNRLNLVMSKGTKVN